MSSFGLLSRWAGGEDAQPVDEVEDEEDARDDDDHDLLHGLALRLLAPPEAVEDEGELQQHEEDEDDAHQHPDIQVGDVGHLKVVMGTSILNPAQSFYEALQFRCSMPIRHFSIYFVTNKKLRDLKETL